MWARPALQQHVAKLRAMCWLLSLCSGMLGMRQRHHARLPWWHMWARPALQQHEAELKIPSNNGLGRCHA